MVNWPTVCRPKTMGGLGLLNTKKMNIALLTKWIWRLYQDEDNIWSRVIRAKYPDANNLLQGSGQGGSQVWKNLHKIKHYFAMGAKFLVRDGGRTRFWLDWWIGDAPLQASFPCLPFVTHRRPLFLKSANRMLWSFASAAPWTKRA
jgi:hypothetical protein